MQRNATQCNATHRAAPDWSPPNLEQSSAKPRSRLGHTAQPYAVHRLGCGCHVSSLALRCSFMDRASAERAREAMCNEIVHGVEMRIGANSCCKDALLVAVH